LIVQRFVLLLQLSYIESGRKLCSLFHRIQSM
jgi:hypothetical protein